MNLYGGQVDVPVTRRGSDAVGRVVIFGVPRVGLGQELVDTLSVWDKGEEILYKIELKCLLIYTF